jgi:hypothetical protein
MAAQPPKQIRKANVAKVADFDDQLWPINVVILIMAAFVAGIVGATSDFRDPRILYNGWVHLGVVATLVGILFWAVVWLQGKMLRRVQFCLLVSLLVHLWLGLYLHDRYLAMVAIEEARQTAAMLDEPEPTTIPDYHWEGVQPMPTRQAFEEPVPTEIPAPSETEPVPQPMPEEEVAVTMPKPVEPDTPRQQEPDPVEIRRAELSAPRRDELAAGAQISRQPWKHRPEPDEPIPQPAVQPAGRQTPSTLNPQVATVRRDDRQPVLERQTFDPQPSATERYEAIQMARRAANSDPLLDRPTTPVPTRQLDRPIEMPRTEAAAAEPIRVAEEEQPPTLDAGATAAQRQLAIPTPAREALPLESLRASTTVDELAMPSAIARRADATEPQPAVGAASPSREMSLARAARGADLPSAILAADDVATPAAAGSAAESRLEISQTSAVERAIDGAPQGRMTAAAGVAEYAVGSGEMAARVGQPRATGSDQPAVAANAPSERIARSLTGMSAPVTARPELDQMPSMAEASGSGGQVRPSADAQATAVGRVGGVGIPSPSPASSLGIGPAGASGASGAAGAMAMARVMGDEPRFSAQPGGGTPRPARSFGRAFAGDARAELPETVPSKPSGGPATGRELQARISGQEREVAGLPGALAGQLDSGALAALTASGAPRRAAAGRRATASQVEPGGSGTAPASGSTLARASRGVDLPQAAKAVEKVSETGAGGLADSPGSSASRLDVGSGTAVRRAAAEVPMANELSAAGTAEFGSGLAQLAAMTASGQAGGAAGLEPQFSGAGEHQATAAASGGSPGDSPPGTTAGPLRLPLGDDPGPSLAAEVGGGPLRKAATPGLIRGLAQAAGAESPAGKVSTEPGDFDVAAGPDMDGLTRRVGGLPVQIAAAPGPGGLSADPAPVVGIPSRRARPESEVIYPVSSRFVLERSGGRLALDGRVPEEPTESFRQRTPQRRSEAAGKFGGTEGTERAVEAGLDFLARHQFPDGHWSIDRFPDQQAPEYRQAAPGQMHSDTAATGLALLAFLGAGYTHQDDKYRTVVRQGLDWLVENQQPGGQLFTDATDQTRYARSYAHGIAAIALCEAYGMTRDPQLRRPAEQAVQYVYDAQHPQLGGWRYTPADDAQPWRKESDTSVSGWQLMALKSAQMAGLPVRQDVLDKVSGWLDSAQSNGGTRYAYNPLAADTAEQRQGRVPNQAMTAEGLLMRMYLGWQRDNPAMVEGAEFLKSNLPEVGTSSVPLRDAYCWYYATQVMFHMQGDFWEAWNGRLHPLLESSQVQSGPLAGSWNPDRPVPDRWAHAGGRHYVTALNILMLEVYYRHLPLFRTLE